MKRWGVEGLNAFSKLERGRVMWLVWMGVHSLRLVDDSITRDCPCQLRTAVRMVSAWGCVVDCNIGLKQQSWLSISCSSCTAVLVLIGDRTFLNQLFDKRALRTPPREMPCKSSPAGKAIPRGASTKLLSATSMFDPVRVTPQSRRACAFLSKTLFVMTMSLAAMPAR